MVCSIFITLQCLQVGAGFFFFIYIYCCTGAFFLANWEEHHTGVLNTNFNGFGTTEMLIIQVILVGLTSLNIVTFTIRDFGLVLFPNTDELWIQETGRAILLQLGMKDEAILSKLAVNITNFSSRSLLIVSLNGLILLTDLVSLITIANVIKTTKKPFLQTIEGLIPMILFLVYVPVSLAYCTITWKVPSIVLFIMGTYFCLSVSKLIVANVTR